MREKFSEIIEIIERADEIFKTVEPHREEAKALWDAGIERLAAAIWICEREQD